MAKKYKKQSRTTRKTSSSVNLYKIAFEGLLLGGCILLFFSVLSFDIGDAPSGFTSPTNQPVANWCGRVGAFCAYYIMYFIGPGALLALAAVSIILIVHLSGRKITQINLRMIGLLLLVVAGSTSWFLLWPDAPFLLYRGGPFPMGNGGILGIAAGIFLRKHLALLGTAITLICTWLVGMTLLADSLVLAVTRGIGHVTLRIFGLVAPAWTAAQKQSQALADIWTRLHEK